MIPDIFSRFEPVSSCSDGRSVYDFLGGSIDAEYKAGWKPKPEGLEHTPGLPGPNEWYVDWLASLAAAYFAEGAFQVVELGAGYAQWMVTSIHAFKSLNPDGPVYGLALEAESVHFQWMQENTGKNLDKYNNVHTTLLNSAAGFDGTVSFPILEDPASVYGASYSSGQGFDKNLADYVNVECLSLKSIYDLTGKTIVDFLHIDIQGAEVDLLLNGDPVNQLANTKIVLIGTHRSNDVHHDVREKINACGFKVVIDWPRNSEVRYCGNSITTHDGALLAANPALVDVELLTKLLGADL